MALKIGKYVLDTVAILWRKIAVSFAIAVESHREEFARSREAIKRCPLCGDWPLVNKLSSGTELLCSRCGTSTGALHSLNEALAVWAVCPPLYEIGGDTWASSPALPMHPWSISVAYRLLFEPGNTTARERDPMARGYFMFDQKQEWIHKGWLHAEWVRGQLHLRPPTKTSRRRMKADSLGRGARGGR